VQLQLPAQPCPLSLFFPCSNADTACPYKGSLSCIGPDLSLTSLGTLIATELSKAPALTIKSFPTAGQSVNLLSYLPIVPAIEWCAELRSIQRKPDTATPLAWACRCAAHKQPTSSRPLFNRAPQGAEGAAGRGGQVHAASPDWQHGARIHCRASLPEVLSRLCAVCCQPLPTDPKACPNSSSCLLPQVQTIVSTKSPPDMAKFLAACTLAPISNASSYIFGVVPK
jgi:hypothetical protein